MNTFVMRSCVASLLIGLLTPCTKAQWTQTSMPSVVVEKLARTETHLFAGTWSGVFVSTNNGASWVQANNGLTNTDVRSLLAYSSNLLAGTYGGGAFLSTNNGTTWTAAGAGLTNTHVRALADSGTTLFAGTMGGGVFRSTSNGTNWAAVSSGLTTTDVRALIVSASNLFAGTCAGGVFLSTNGGTSWTAVNNGLTNTAVWALALSRTNLFAGTWGGAFLSTNNGTSWTAVGTGLPSTINTFAVCPDSNQSLLAGSVSGGVFLSTNNGNTWTAVNTGLTNSFVSDLIISGTDVFAGTSGGVWRRSLSQITSVKYSIAGVAMSFELRQNYPNPFNSTTQIEFQVPSTDQVSLRVYDVLGKEIAVLVNQRLSAGYHKAEWEASTFATGVYLYQLRAGVLSQTRKLLLSR